MTKDALFALACLAFFIATIIYCLAKAWAPALTTAGLLLVALALAIPIVIK